MSEKKGEEVCICVVPKALAESMKLRAPSYDEALDLAIELGRKDAAKVRAEKIKNMQRAKRL